MANVLNLCFPFFKACIIAVVVKELKLYSEVLMLCFHALNRAYNMEKVHL